MNYHQYESKEHIRIPQILMCRYHDVIINGNTPDRVVRDYEFELNMSKDRTMTINGITFDAPQNSFIVRKPGMWVHSSGDIHGYDILFDFSYTRPIGENYDIYSPTIQEPYDSYLWDIIPTIFVPNHTEDIKKILDRLKDLYAHYEDNKKIIDLSILELFHILMADATSYEISNHIKEMTVIDEICQYMQMNFSQDIDLTSLAKLAHLNKNHFARKFKNETGVSPIDYLINTRLKNAKEMLGFCDLPVKTISADCGFNNPAYFNYVFKKHFGITPGEYRDQVRYIVPLNDGNYDSDI